jgi:hypothetical protein
MNHQPFESWILEDQKLSSEETASLRAHLDTCPQCLKTNNAWLDVRYRIQHDPLVKPATGFTQRWQTGLEARRIKEEKRITRLVLLGLISAAFVLSLSLGLIFFTYNSLGSVLASLFRAFASASDFFEQVGHVLTVWVKLSSTAYPFLIIMAVIGWTVLMSVVFIPALLRFRIKGDTQS